MGTLECEKNSIYKKHNQVVENVNFMILVGLHIGWACKSSGENVTLVKLLGVEVIKGTYGQQKTNCEECMFVVQIKLTFAYGLRVKSSTKLLNIKGFDQKENTRKINYQFIIVIYV